MNLPENTRLIFDLPFVLANYEGVIPKSTFDIFDYLEQFTSIESVAVTCNQGGAAWYLTEPSSTTKFKSPEKVLRMIEGIDHALSKVIKIDWFVALHPGEKLIQMLNGDEDACNELAYEVDNIWKFDLAHQIKSLTTFTDYFDRLPELRMVEYAIGDSKEFLFIGNENETKVITTACKVGCIPYEEITEFRKRF